MIRSPPAAFLVLAFFIHRTFLESRWRYMIIIQVSLELNPFVTILLTSTSPSISLSQNMPYHSTSILSVPRSLSIPCGLAYMNPFYSNLSPRQYQSRPSRLTPSSGYSFHCVTMCLRYSPTSGPLFRSIALRIFVRYGFGALLD